jgi:hypothetical protein
MISVDLWRWYINITITILDIIYRPAIYLKLDFLCTSVPHTKHITSDLRAQQVNAIYRFVRMVYYKKSKVIGITGLEGLQGREMLRIPHCLDKRLTDGGKVVSPTHRAHFTPRKHYFSVSGTNFC